MTDENKIRDVVDAVTGVAKAVPIYQDLVQPAAQEIGKALQTVAKSVHMALAPVSALVWGYDQIKEFVSTKVAERLKNVAEENLITPPAHIAGPALEALRYTGHESTLSELYANLLATSMDANTVQDAHPAFVEIIKQLTPDEAKLIGLFLKGKPLPLINLLWEFKPNTSGKSGGKMVLSHHSHLGNMADCQYPQLMPAYINNLCRLGLAEVPAFWEYTSPAVYDALEKDTAVQENIEKIKKNVELQPVIQRKGLLITELGKQFLNACVVHKQ